VRKDKGTTGRKENGQRRKIERERIIKWIKVNIYSGCELN